MAARVIFHIDLNAYFASAEMIKNSALQGQPVAVAGHSRRGVVTTASYEARAFGVRSAMPVYEAMKLCPQLVIVEPDFGWYQQLSKKFFAYIRTFSPFVEPASIDECYVDVTEAIKNYKRPLDLAWKIQTGVMENLGLGCSIGVGPNRFLAKMASDMKKPMGIMILRKQEIPAKLWPLDVSSMFGVGKKSAKVLKENGIMTIGDLANEQNEEAILTLFGRSKQAYSMISHARGGGSNELNFNQSVQSISQSTTMETNVREYTEIKTIFKRLAHSLSNHAKKKNVKGKLISISVRYSDFRTVSRSMQVEQYTDNEDVLLECALTLFDQVYEEEEIRHLGIGLGTLYSSDAVIEQLDLFKVTKEEDSIQDVIEQLNKTIPGANFVSAASIKKRD